ncbi:MAG: 2,3-bisphosphoglycerate-independent phosphoglycerate mutase [Parcubacteria group bacterium Gr01-1014_18]|nr:MAG: 2,3-bisphosphoglycerate-independent phosphoglycerate mutase [Parcubacteria group bacterium Greene0416_36]TSC81419.1 MAG: 2,3-bisphosphoglycerate-independent phosphoglycerate mutase [Parcubacteria group bacterium Gr01-1014_18]TSC99017.1 MAG: 2,3-bisphosphoglycerate-independent phosphoglycerate mutase [Parcubacteria group bacterium Greene1014_20]TSD07302.1 MAG: 2,3-bisphosphoglycerate-independent phosphoglycerate mutase [Parcubacteria group bacterium Greene0714_2]
MAKTRPVLKIILDGFGKNPLKDGNAVYYSKTPTLDYFLRNYPYAVIEASGMAVGLPWGEVGNSEVGHTNLGSGQVIYQNLPRISLSIENKTFYKNSVLLDACARAKKNKGALHLMGVVSNGGVHSHIEHLDALLFLAREQKVPSVFVHAFLDGRDTAPTAGVIFLETLEDVMKTTKVGKLASVIGRYWSMDRNNNWDRTQKAYALMTEGSGTESQNVIETVKAAYAAGKNDENMDPIVMTDGKGNAVGNIKDGDVVIFFNFRPDRARQIARAFVAPVFDGFPRSKKLDIHFVGMMQYEAALHLPVVFPPQDISLPVGKVISEAGKKQLRIAETEKYAHVTYFYNGGVENPFEGEEHIMVPSPNVESYDQVPKMSSGEVTDKLIDAIRTGDHDFILLNYANPDMIGHTGNWDACIETIEATDGHLKRLYDEFVVAKNGIMLILADHGNIEVMIDPITGRIHKEHTSNPVGVFLVDRTRKYDKPEDLIEIQKLDMTAIGILADIGPTILDMLDIPKPPEMTGRSIKNDCV